MAEFKLGRIRFVWKGDWTASTVYYKDDVIKYGGKTFICQIGHTSDSNFYTDVDVTPTRWNQMTDGQEWRGEWDVDTVYAEGDIVKYGGLLYIANDGHTSAATTALGLEADLSKWTLFGEGFDWKDNWSINTRYKKNDLVRYGGYTYVCNLGHTSAATTALGLETDSAKWDIFNPGIEYKGNWVGPSTRYKINDVVKQGAGLWICTTYHTSTSSFETDESNWSLFTKGFEFESEWNISTDYQPGDIVRYGGNQYVALTNHSGENPRTATSDWSLFAEGFNWVSDWNISTNYRIGDVSRVNGYTYIAVTDSPTASLTVTNTSASTQLFTTADTSDMVVDMVIQFTGSTFGNVFNGATYYVKQIVSETTFTVSTSLGGTVFVPTTGSGSMTATFAAHPTNTTYWNRLNAGIQWKGPWQDDFEYNVGDAVRYDTNAYICVNKHRSEAEDGSTVGTEGGGADNSRPDQDTDGVYWNLLSVGSETSVLIERGDLVYFGGAGPTRLPVGIEGQVLRAGENYPEWVTLNEVDHLYFVGTHGTDLPAPVWGKSYDKPWKTIRYAAEQVEKGPRNPNTKRLLEMNRVFIQREVSEWIKYQINYYTNTVPTPTSIWYEFDYDEYKCERDTGFIVDALIYDLGHGGNVKSRGAALAYVNALLDSPGDYLRLAEEADQDVEAFQYMLTVVEDVLDQQAPAVNYQTTNGDNSTAIVTQWFDANLTSEAGVMTTITSLVGIVTDAIVAGDADEIPARSAPNNLIRVATGRYREVLPIIVPEQTCIIGDELRSTNTGPREGTTALQDSYYSSGSLSRLSSVVSDIIVGNSVTPTTGNTETQDQNWPYASSVQQSKITQLVRTMQHNIDFRLGTTHKVSISDPTNYNVGYLIGYGNARKLIKENKKFFQEELIGFIADQYPTVKYSRTICKRDVGYIVDAVVYDLTFGGYTQSLNAGLAYFDGPGGSLMFNSSEKSATLASYAYLKTLMQGAAQNNIVGGYQNTVLQYRGTGGAAGAVTLIGTALDIIYNIVNSGTTAAPSITVTQISSGTLTTSAAHGLSAGDVIIPRTSHESFSSSFGLTGLIEGTKYYVLTTPASNTLTVSTAFDGSAASFSNVTGSVVCDIIDNPDTSWITVPALPNAFTVLSGAVTSIAQDTIDWINANYGSFKYNSTKCRRDLGYIMEGIKFDVLFGTNFNSVRNGITYRMATASEVITGQLTETTGSLLHARTEVATALATSSTAVTRSNSAFTEIVDIIKNGEASANALVFTDPGLDNNKLYARQQLVANRSFIRAEIISWIGTYYPGLSYNQDKCSRDIGFIVDALCYDMQYGGNTATRFAAQQYFENSVSVLPAAQKAATAAALDRLKMVVGDIVAELTVAKTGSYPETQDTSGTAASSTEVDEVAGLVQIIEDVVTADSLSGMPSAIYPSIAWVDSALLDAVKDLSLEQSDIITGTLQYISDTYNSFSYNQAKCSRDVGIILNAVGFDFMFDSNYQTLKAGYSYLRASADDVFDLGQKQITRDALEYARTLAIANVGGESTAISRINDLMQLLDDIIFSGSNEGNNCASELRSVDYAVLQLERNRDFVVEEIRAYMADTYSGTVTATTAVNGYITVDDTSWMQRGAAIRFSGTTIGGISSGVTYYVNDIIDAVTIRIALQRDTTDYVFPEEDSGSMAVSLFFNSDLCLRDVNEYLDALKYDLKYPGNYKSLLAARYYANSVVGSLEEDMYYLRDGTGIRDQTLEGLTGDLLAPNAYGTSRVSGGAYCSLDPGWGPDDYRAWIINRSPYVQGVTTFGYAAIGQKIDGALHNGGNDSIVSNDFTQVISDGIGAWVANNGRAELVSVFTYYAHIGYLCTEGGRIRGTNGNNSYGDFGSVAEGFDGTETPNTAIIDNKFSYTALVGSVLTNGSNMLQFEYDHAGNDYTEATWTLTGGGSGAVATQDEFRDGAVFQVRLLDLQDDSSGQFGGEGYLLAANTAQGGTSNSITLAATDEASSTAYVGMKIILTGGQGAGQTAIIGSYNSGSKVANLVSEYTGAAGWDHVIRGTTIVSPDASTTYIIEPSISFASPGFTTELVDVGSAGTNTGAFFGKLSAVYTSVVGDYNGLGEGALFRVVKNSWKYIVSIESAGAGYSRLETITIAGTDLGGSSPANDITITITSVNSVTGAIEVIESEGYGRDGIFLVHNSSTSEFRYSYDLQTWNNTTTYGQSTAVVGFGLFDDGSTNELVSKFVALNSAGSYYSYDGVNWVLSVNSGFVWNSQQDRVVFGNSRFLIPRGTSTDIVDVTLDGEVWDLQGTLPSSGDWRIAYGNGKFVAVKYNSDEAATSTDGITWEVQTLATSLNWTNIDYGNGRFVAVAVGSNTVNYSFDGINWLAASAGSPDSTSVGFLRIRYSQGLFVASSGETGTDLTGYDYCATSEDGLVWTWHDLPQIDAPGVEGGYSTNLAAGTVDRMPKWITMRSTNSDQVCVISTGATARARAFVAEEKIFAIRIVEPGSGYTSAPTMTITDPNNLYELPYQVRIGYGVLGNPSFSNRGTQYATGSAEIDTGDGYADFYQYNTFVAVRRITQRPVPGSNVVFGHLPDRTFKLVNVITFLGENDGSYTAFYQISPSLSISEAPEHATSVTTRIRYSQVRLTGHDFLDIGTGNFVESNYPGLPTQDPIPANETVDNNGGRVFYTSTDQDGNFRVGGLFSIEQSTGIATLNADAFNISGLQELNLGNVTLGGGSATITEFSTDPFFTADSDNIIPTQRAIKAYIAAQIGGGGAALNVNSVTAGSIFINTNQITTITGEAIYMNATFEFRGGVTGLPLAFGYFLT